MAIFQLYYKHSEHALDFVDFLIKLFVLRIYEHLEIPCEKQMAFEFRGGASRDLQETSEVGIGASATPLGDVCRNGHGGPARLTRQTIKFLIRKPRGGFIYIQREPMTLLPDFVFLEIARFCLASLDAFSG